MRHFFTCDFLFDSDTSVHKCIEVLKSDIYDNVSILNIYNTIIKVMLDPLKILFPSMLKRLDFMPVTRVESSRFLTSVTKSDLTRWQVMKKWAGQIFFFNCKKCIKNIKRSKKSKYCDSIIISMYCNFLQYL